MNCFIDLETILPQLIWSMFHCYFPRELAPVNETLSYWLRNLRDKFGHLGVLIICFDYHEVLIRNRGLSSSYLLLSISLIFIKKLVERLMKPDIVESMSALNPFGNVLISSPASTGLNVIEMSTRRTLDVNLTYSQGTLSTPDVQETYISDISSI